VGLKIAFQASIPDFVLFILISKVFALGIIKKFATAKKKAWTSDFHPKRKLSIILFC